MRNCIKCKGRLQELKAKTPENIWYNYYKCRKCGEEIVDMEQLHEVAKPYYSTR